MRPRIALAMGDPAGISPELTARLLALDEIVSNARTVVIGDRRVLDDGARVAGVKLDAILASPDADLSKEQRAPIFIDLAISIRRRLRKGQRRPWAAGLRWPIIVRR
jgi:4-hydroxythreonine-4-phosphate dehydrogenase